MEFLKNKNEAHAILRMIAERNVVRTEQCQTNDGGRAKRSMFSPQGKCNRHNRLTVRVELVQTKSIASLANKERYEPQIADQQLFACRPTIVDGSQ